MAKKVYAIKEGFDSQNNRKIENTIVNTWAECLKYVKGVKGAKYKSFEDINEAKEFLSGAGDVLKKEDNNYPKDCLHIYVDGSYNTATEEYSYGMVAVENEVVLDIKSGTGKSDSANNIRQIAGELEGAVKGVEYALERGDKKVVIFHDYIGICYHATGLWERKEESSKEYYLKMQGFMNQGIDIIFVKVDSHTGDLFNELVDEKCKEELGITSDKVVEKHLKKDIIRVKSNIVKESIESIAPNNSENIIVVEDGTIEVIESLETNDIIEVNVIEELNKVINNLSVEKQLLVLDYAKNILK